MPNYSEMTKSELLAEIQEKSLQDLIGQTAKYPAKPTNEELIKVLTEGIETSEPDVVVNDIISGTDVVDPSIYAVTDKQELINVETDLMIPVIVTDHDNSQSTEENLESLVFRGSCGNLYTGTISFAVVLHGKMQYLPKIVIDHLKTILMVSNYKDASGNEVSARNKPRFSIVEVQGWTEEELEAHKQEQSLKKL